MFEMDDRATYSAGSGYFLYVVGYFFYVAGYFLTS